MEAVRVAALPRLLPGKPDQADHVRVHDDQGDRSMSRYAEGTEVSVDKSLAEIRSHMNRWGAEGFMHSEDPDTGNVRLGFRLRGAFYRFDLPTPSRAKFSGRFADTQYQAEIRRRWRVLAAFTKAQLFGIEEGLIGAEKALLPFRVLAGGDTLSELMDRGHLDKMLVLPPGVAT